LETAETYVTVAQARTKDFGVRLVICAFIAAAAYVIFPSIWPGAWICATACAQLLDRVLSRRIAASGQEALRFGGRALIVLMAAANSTIFGSISLYMWFQTDTIGSWFALLLCCGGMLHVTLRNYPSQVILIASGAPYVVFLLGAPLLLGALSPDEDLVTYGILSLCGLLYVAYLAIAARQSKAGLRQLELANRQAHEAREQAERASAAKSEFLATISHEIRTPMNAVVSAAHLLKRTPLNAEQQEHVAMLSHGGEVLIGLLNDVLDVSKIEAGKMILEDAEVDLPEVLRAIARLYAPRLAANGVRFDLDIEDAPNLIQADPLRLRQILFNLLSNAAKFTERGHVALRARVIETDEGERLWFEIEDTGCGIDDEAMGRLFGSFEQARTATARNNGGTGLGLAISRRLAELMGGGLNCISAVGVGSIFELELPLVRVEATSAPADRAANDDPEDRPPLSILLAEDHEVNRRIVGLFLEPLGWRLTMVENGQEAVEAAGRQMFDAILLDMQMPVMGGLEAAALIRAPGAVNATTPIIALTANALDHFRDAWAQVGAAAFLTKPIDPQLLVATLIATQDTPRTEPLSTAVA